MLNRIGMTAGFITLAFALLTGRAWPADLTLRSMGAVGDGKTDDRAAIQAALNKANGALIDGENATYAVHGNIEVRVDVHLTNATFVQTMAPVDTSRYMPSAGDTEMPTVEPAQALTRMVGRLPLLHASGVATYSEDPALTPVERSEVLPTIALRTLAILGSDAKRVSVRLQTIRVLRGSHPQTGGADGGGILVDYAAPVVMDDVEVTGDGKGAGISISNSAQVQLKNLNIHDMNWAPYAGDNIFEVASVKSIKEDFGWNNFPIYQFDTARDRFVRVRVQEQLTGLALVSCNEVQLVDSRVARLQTKIGDRLYPLQADGVTVGHVRDFVVRNCHFSEVWEGIDFTYNSGENFVYENCTTSDTLVFGFKLAHPKRNGKLIDCTSYRAGGAGFVMEPEVENVEFIRCQAVETGAGGYWTTDDGRRLMTIAGFRLDTRSGLPTPRHIKFDMCQAINTTYPGAMDFGFLCGSDIDPAERDVRAIDCTSEGERVSDVRGIVSN